MKIEEVKKLSPLEIFIYWIRERHQIYLRRLAGKSKPWTDDEVLQNFFFTNPYRENDKVTVWFKENIREPLRNSPEVLFATVCFRWFNYIPTAQILLGLTRGPNVPEINFLVHWDRDDALARLSGVRKHGGQIFTGAYMINSPGGEPKLEAIIRRITNVWTDRKHLMACWDPDVTIEEFHDLLTTYEGLGGFMAYEVVCDLRYTYLLENAPDKMTWCNPGPGCIRGLYRIAGEDFPKGNNSTSPPRPKDWQDRMVNLLALAARRLPKMPKFEMREIEHSLCEFDKYMRALSGDGRLKRRYAGK